MRPARTEYVAARSATDALSRCRYAVGATIEQWQLSDRYQVAITTETEGMAMIEKIRKLFLGERLPTPEVKALIRDLEHGNMIDQADRLQNRAAWHREQLEAIATEFAQLHGYNPKSREGQDLAMVIWFGESYTDKMVQIMERKKCST